MKTQYSNSTIAGRNCPAILFFKKTAHSPIQYPIYEFFLSNLKITFTKCFYTHCAAT